MQRMDLEEWEFLPSDGFINLHEDVPGGNHKKISSSSNPKSVIDMNYFQKFVEPQQKKIDTRAVPVVPIQLDQKIEKIPVDEKEIPEDQGSKEQITGPKLLGSSETCDQETISQVFFKKMKENEFVDMKMDSPKSQNRGFLPQIDVGTYQFEEKDGNFEEEPAIMNKDKGSNLEEEDVNWEDNNNGGLNIWKWAMTGIGAVFSFGIAAATVSLIVVGNRHKERQHQKGSELHFQIHPHEKRIKQVVHHAKKINDAIAAVRGAPLTRAQITIGGYYEGL